MAWVTPSTRATGDLITSAIWNADVVANPQYLKGQAGTVALEATLSTTGRLHALLGHQVGTTATGIYFKTVTALASSGTTTLMDVSLAYGHLFISETAVFGQTGLYAMRSANGFTEVSDPGTLFTATSGTTGMINFYVSGSTMIMQNYTSVAVTVNLMVIRHTGG